MPARSGKLQSQTRGEQVKRKRKHMRTHYHQGFMCTDCGQVHLDRPRECLNCGRREFLDLNDGSTDDPRGDEVRLNRRGGIVASRRSNG